MAYIIEHRSTARSQHKRFIERKASLHRALLLSILAIVITLCVSCGDNGVVAQLDRADSLMESKPDSSLAILNSIDAKLLDSRELQARYALLHSMALDKNYVDTTNFDVLQPAIDYYITDNNGSPNEQLRTYYYRGRIYDNAGKYNEAIQSFTYCTQMPESATDYRTRARAYSMKGVVFTQLFNYESALKNKLKALSIWESNGDIKNTIDCRLAAVGSYHMLGKGHESDSLISLCYEDAPKVDYDRNLILSIDLTHALRYSSKEEVQRLLKERLRDSAMTIDDWISVSYIYASIDDIKAAKTIINQLDTASIKDKDLRRKLHGTCYYIQKRLHNDSLALMHYEQFNAVYGDFSIKNMRKSIQAVESECEAQIQTQKKADSYRMYILLLMATLIIILLCSVILVLCLRNARNKKNQLVAINEKMALATAKLNARLKLYEDEQFNADIDKDACRLDPQSIEDLVKKMSIFKSLLTSHIIGSLDINSKQIVEIRQHIEDVPEFLRTNKSLIERINPAFIKYLYSCGLTEREIEYVCLFALGLTAQEISLYVKKKAINNISSSIRKKLNLDAHSTNLRNCVSKHIFDTKFE